MTLKNNRAPFLRIIKLYASFHHHMWTQTRVTVRKPLSWVVTSVTLTFDLDLLHGPYPGLWWQLLKILWWYDDGNIVKNVWQTDRQTEWTIHRAAWSQLKTIGHLFYATSSFVQHFVAIGEFKLELQSGNAQSGSNSTIFKAVRPWNLTDDLGKQEGTSSMLLQALCSISYPLVNSILSYSPETLNSGQNRRFFSRVT